MIILDSLGYRLAETQRSLTSLQRLILLYGYAYLNAQRSGGKAETKPLDELVNLLPRG